MSNGNRNGNNGNNSGDAARRRANGNTAMICLMTLAFFYCVSITIGFDWIVSALMFLVSIGAEEGSAGYIAAKAKLDTVIMGSQLVVAAVTSTVGWLSINNNRS